MRVIFVSGKYRDKDWDAIEQNIQKAREASIQLWGLGWAVYCPHLNTAHFDGLYDDKIWLAGDLEILSRCDAIYMLDNYEDSEGAKREIEKAKEWGKPVYWQTQGLVTPSGGIIKVHQCKFPVMINDMNNRERFCGHCGFTEYMDKPVTTDSRSFARIK